MQSKVAFITAAGQGIGRAIAEAFVAEGASDRDRRRPGQSGRDQGRDRAKLDAMFDGSVEAAAKEVGPIDVLVNAAGFVHHGTVLRRRRTGTAPSTSTSNPCTARSRPSCRACWRRAAGSIVNIASGASSVRGLPNRYVYGATKAAVIGLTKAVAADFIKQGIRVQRDLPRHDPSPSLDERIDDAGEAERRSRREVREGLHRSPADGPARHREEIAWLAVYLASDERATRPADPSRRRRFCAVGPDRRVIPRKRNPVIAGFSTLSTACVYWVPAFAGVTSELETAQVDCRLVTRNKPRHHLADGGGVLETMP